MTDRETRPGRRNGNAPATLAQDGGTSMARFGFFGVVIGLIALAALILDGYYTIGEGERGVLLRYGQVHSVSGPGLHFKLPLIDSVERMSVLEENIRFDNQSSYSNDLQEAKIDISVNFAIVPTDEAVIEVYRRYQQNYRETAILPVVPQQLKEVFGRYQAANVVNQRDRLGIEVQNAIINSAPKDIFRIVRVQITNIDFSDQYEQAIEDAARVEAEVRRAKNELERQKIEAEKVVVVATANANAVREAAKAEADRIKLAGEAEASAIRAKAEALKDNPQLVALIAAERWNGVLPTTQVPGSAVPFIELPQTPPR